MAKMNTEMGLALCQLHSAISNLCSECLAPIGYTMKVDHKKLSEYESFESLETVIFKLSQITPLIIIIELDNIRTLTSYMLGNMMSVQSIIEDSGGVMVLKNVHEEISILLD